MSSPKTGKLAPVIKITPEKTDFEKILLIAQALRKRAVIAYPTDTFYGLGADCRSVPSLRRIFQIKQRLPLKPIPVLVSEISQVKTLAAEVPPIFERLTDAFWPGPLTVVLKAARNIPSVLAGPNQTIGMRLPAVSWLRELIKQAGFPIVATSANISGKREIDSAEEVIRQFRRTVDMIVDGGRTPGGRPSTVVDVSGDIPRIIRIGAVPEAEIEKILSL
jgi:L-threonylcarbamoyladenylate synthase